ncbi:DoxX family protein [Terriglobus aquaticus]|uniref:DoxX family protein n=1 Tax=Terriglobus aquaticus TaxID=940139 RepID=A0ABW9KKP4_9BACT|nr:DoxX family protein [Terriglobus aquaticus]
MPQSKLARAGLYVQSAFYFVAGGLHLWRPRLYLAIMPDHYSHPVAWVAATGVAEIAGAIGLLLPATRRAAAIGIILMLVGYFDVHIFMLQHAGDRFASIPHWALIVRLPLQLVLIAWAAAYARRSR